MRDFIISSALKKDVKRAQKRNQDLSSFKEVVEILMKEESLPPKFKDHPLVGNWIGYRELHLAPDFLFIYRIEANTIYGQRLGTHSDLF